MFLMDYAATKLFKNNFNREVQELKVLEEQERSLKDHNFEYQEFYDDLVIQTNSKRDELLK